MSRPLLSPGLRVGRGGRVPVWGLLQNRDFSLLWAAGGLDNLCRWMDAVVMGWLVLERTDSPWQVALVFVLRWIPMLLFAMFSGVVADRASRWHVMLLARGVTALVTAVLLALVISDRIAVWHVLLGSLLLGWMYVLDFPSRRSFIYDLVGPQRVVSAMSMETINSTIGKVLGPLSAGLFISLTGFTGAYVSLLAVYIVALLLVARVRSRIVRPATAPRSVLRSLAAGLGYSLHNPVIMGVLGITLIMNAMAFSAEPLLPVVARDHLKVGAGLTGVLVAAAGIGTLAGAMVISCLGSLTYHGRIFTLGISLQLLGLLLFALSPWYPLSFLMLLVSGLGSSGYSTMQSAIILMSAAPENRGAALGVLGQCIGVAALGGLVMGAVADLFNSQFAIGISAFTGLVLLVPIVILSPLVWRPVASQPETTPLQPGSAASTQARPL